MRAAWLRRGEARGAVLTSPLDRRPVVVAIAGPDGAGRTTFFHAHLAAAGLRFANADVIAREIGADSYAAAAVADAVRRELLRSGESFVSETVFSDPAGQKLSFLTEAAAAGHTVVLCFIGVTGPGISEERVEMRVLPGGHDVPTENLVERYPRVMRNLRRAIRVLPHVLVFDDDDLGSPFRRIAEYESGRPVFLADALPEWFRASG